MKKIALYILFSLFCGVVSANTHAYVSSSVMNSGKWVKMRVSTSGVYKLAYQDIVSAGLDPNDIHIYGYGGAMLSEDLTQTKQDDLPEVAIYMNKGADGVFNSGDYILFYAQGPISWQYNTVDKEFEHNVNPYSSYGYYFLSSGQGTPTKTIALSSPIDLQGNTPLSISTFTDYSLHEKDLVNLVASGREFYGEEFDPTSVYQTIVFNFPNIVSGSTAILRFDGAIYSITGDLKESSFTINVNNNSTTVSGSNISTTDYYTKGTDAYLLFPFSASSSSTIDVNLKFYPEQPSSQAWLNYVAINAQRNLVMTGSYMPFRNLDLMKNKYGQFNLTTTNSNLQIWDVTNSATIAQMPTTFTANQNLMSFVAQNQDSTTIREFVALDVTASSSFSSPEIVGQVSNQNLHALANPDFIIISHPDYLAQAQELAQAHQEKDNMSVLIVTPDQIYNEFSSGTPDASAYRWFAKMFYDRKNNGTASKALKYLLLLGDGSYDNRQLIYPADNCNKLLTYQSYSSLVETDSYVTDDFFGFLDDSEKANVLGSNLLNIGIGRIPSNTVQQAEAAVQKSISYMNNEYKGVWKNELCYVADDGDDITHVSQADSIARGVTAQYPEFQITKLYIDAYKQITTPSGAEYPEVNTMLLNSVKNGLLILNYTGHGGPQGWSNEKILTTQGILGMYNTNLALWVTATCDFSRYDSPTISAGEDVLFNSTGGGIALFSTTRVVFSSPNFNLNSMFYKNVFTRDENGNRLRFGDIIKKTKCALVGDDNKLNFTLLGDPALMLEYPNYKILTDSVNGKDANAAAPTIHALDKVTLKGHINGDDGSLMTNFNGNVTITVYDKAEKVRTLNNDGCTSRDSCGIYTFTDRAILYSGMAQVVDGEFAITFLVPKDINYTFGTGKINYYASDDINNYEAQGFYTNFIIGGSSNQIITDTIGPQIKMYLNTPSFVSGDKVNESPLFVSKVSDPYGINIVGSGIGHDIVMQLDNTDWTVLNDYFQSDLGTYQSGTVTYQLSNLTDGSHTLNFRVWDLLDNSSSASLNFNVVTGLPLNIIDAFCYPNPANGMTTFVLNHDRPDELANVVISVYDLTGREVYSLNTEVYLTGNATTIAQWNLETNSGQKLQPGIYLYKLQITTPSAKTATQSKKIIITG
jgi:hypothetical protein